MNYKQAVKKNLEHLGTPHNEWQPVEIKQMVKTQDDAGKEVMMPEFDFPIDYQTAPSLYRNTNHGDICCELCAHPIKNVFHIQNDDKKWIMIVGSECVTHFANGKSGIKIAKETQWAINRQFLRDAIEYKKEIEKKYRKSYLTQGYYQQRIYYFQHKGAQSVWKRLSDITKDRRPDGDKIWKTKADSNGIITRWVNTYGDEVKKLMSIDL